MKAKLEAFMRGRNGMDRMNRGLVLIYVLLMVFNMFFSEEEFRTVNLDYFLQGCKKRFIKINCYSICHFCASI